MHLETGHADTSVKLSEIGVENYVIPAGDFDLEIRLFRLADVLVKGPITASVDVPIKAQGDTHGFVPALWDKPRLERTTARGT